MKSLLKQTIEVEVKKFRTGWGWYLLGAILFIVLPYLNHIYIDGIYTNKVIVFREPVNPLALRTDKDQYCPTEQLRIETSFCKERSVLEVKTSWWVANGGLEPVGSNTYKENTALPSNFCFPAGGEGVSVYKIHSIPADAQEGFHRSVGHTVYLLNNIYSDTPRVREQRYATIPYYIKSKEACEAEGFYENNN